ncbi:hypothetical protein NXS19_001953 [Fusarium pseudograminearum]|uniref:WGS project CBMD000000000 data, contig CS3427_c000214 n=2 Tax=Fusarium pseudograminearum TaxID=101028 RepID=A0A096PCF7_FUSPS|nr:hypothetical protein NXS19_001953 [Fusarium pseudograminearum]CEG02389.1 unnamed protein product [Fusarium pseudograminearum CS3427]CEG02648.1 unnamed protein product [Fusarium pseudograminearum CS3487]
MQSLVKVAEDILLQLCCEVWTFDDEYNQSYPASQDTAKNTGKQKISRTLRETPRSDSRVTAPNMNNSLLRLPAEIQIMILQHLTFGQVEALRRTCRSLRYNLSKPVIRFIFPSIKYELLSTCYRCLAYDPERDTLIKADESDARYPLANECIDCVASRGGFSIGRTYTLASRSTVCVCRYCGFPVTSDAAWKEYEFHRKCYRRYRMILLYYFLSGFAQGTITIAASALCWRYYKGRAMIIAPTIINFLMSCWVFSLNMVRGIELRTYHWSLLLEMSILGLWIPPLNDVIRIMTQRDQGVKTSDIATVFFIGTNIIFRSLNIFGNTFLTFEYQLWRRFQPQQSTFRRMLNKAATFAIFWTYPPSIEQKFPGRWFRRRSPPPSRPICG